MKFIIAAIFLTALAAANAEPSMLCNLCATVVGQVEKVAKAFPAVVNALTANEQAFCSLLPGSLSTTCQKDVAGKLADINKALVDQEDPAQFCVQFFGCGGGHKSPMELVAASRRCRQVTCNLYCPFDYKRGTDNCPVCECQRQEEMTSCQGARWNGLHNKMMGAFVPDCNLDGSYGAKQCRDAACACHTYDGKPFTSWVAATQDLHCDCLREVEDSKGLIHPIGNFVPKCESDGLYSKVQCHTSTGFCWCADQKSGEKVTEPARQRPSC